MDTVFNERRIISSIHSTRAAEAFRHEGTKQQEGRPAALPCDRKNTAEWTEGDRCPHGLPKPRVYSNTSTNRLAQRSGTGEIGICAFLRAHDVSWYQGLSSRKISGNSNQIRGSAERVYDRRLHQLSHHVRQGRSGHDA